MPIKQKRPLTNLPINQSTMNFVMAMQKTTIHLAITECVAVLNQAIVMRVETE